MRIMHVVRSDRFAGVEQFVRRLAIAQARAGHRVHVAGGAEDRMRAQLETAGATWEPLTGWSELITVLRRHGAGADVVNTHMTDADVAASALLPRRGVALVSTRHFALPRRRWGRLSVDALVRRRIDAEISISRAVAETIGVPSTVVHTGVPEAARSHGDDSKRMLMAQRLQPEKRTQVGIDAFLRSGLAEEGWVLDVAGDGPLRSAAQRSIRDHDAGSAVRLLGFRDDVPALLDSAAIFLATCPVEGLGLSALEAMAAGVAPLVADAAGHRDLVEGLDDAARFTPDDAESAAEALRILATDGRRRAALASAARDRARTEFSVANQLTRTQQVYRTAMTRRSR